MPITANVIPFRANTARNEVHTSVPEVPSTICELEHLEQALRTRGVLMAHYGPDWLLASATRPDLAIVLDPSSPQLEYHGLNGEPKSGYLITLAESDRVDLIAATVGVKS